MSPVCADVVQQHRGALTASQELSLGKALELGEWRMASGEISEEDMMLIPREASLLLLILIYDKTKHWP